MTDKTLPQLAQEIAAQRSAKRPRARLKRAHEVARQKQHRTLESYAWLRHERRFATHAPEDVRADALHIGAPEFARGVIEAMRHRGSECPLCHAQAMQSWAFQAFARFAGWAGAQTQVVIAIWNQLGVRDESEARALVDLAKSAQGKTPDDTARDALAYLTEHYRAQGKRVVVLEDATPKATEGGNGAGA